MTAAVGDLLHVRACIELILSFRMLSAPILKSEMSRKQETKARAYSPMKNATTTMKKKSGSEEGKGGDSPSQLIDARIKELNDWRGETLARVRILIRLADPEVVDEWKWRGVPVWSHAGIICTGETYKNVAVV
jgi:hypothetical protein